MFPSVAAMRNGLIVGSLCPKLPLCDVTTLDIGLLYDIRTHSFWLQLLRVMTNVQTLVFHCVTKTRKRILLPLPASSISSERRTPP